MDLKLVSLRIDIDENPIIIGDRTGFQVVATYDDGKTRIVTDSVDYSMLPDDIGQIEGIELWVNNDSWANNDTIYW